MRYGTSWGVWVAEKLPFGSETVIKVIDDIVRTHVPSTLTMPKHRRMVALNVLSSLCFHVCLPLYRTRSGRPRWRV